MDNLTHSLVGALLGQMGLKRRTGLAMPTLIIAANLPDIDATCTVFGMRSLAMRRGITHGPIALIILPLVLAGAMLAWDRWQHGRGKRPPGRLPVRFGWLLALAYAGCLSHPAFDWLNNYGIRLLEPFSPRWFYGDTLFIIDPWLLALLAAAVFASLRLERRARPRWNWPAWAAAVMALSYIGLNHAISQRAVAAGHEVLLAASNPPSADTLVVANVPPLAFWERELLWRDRDHYGRGTYDGWSGKAAFEQRHRLDSPEPPRASGGPLAIQSSPTGIEPWLYDHARNYPDARAFLFWSRMPVATRSREGYVLRDQRFMNSPAARSFSVALPRPE